jgi:hypothetical protein|tara:strand:- start:581 stop:859 length:279 start_codon:yes stop_codon:yes gene_type:complete
MSEEAISNPLQFSNLIVHEKKMSFQRWCETSIKSYDPEFWISDKEPVTHQQYIVEFYYQLKELIIASGHVIEDEKQFKDEIATLIYHLSSEE